MKSGENLEIVAIDDDPGHCELIRRNLLRAGIVNRITTFHSGREGLDYVLRRGASAARPVRGGMLVLLDIRMPGEMDGVEVLRAIKADARQRRLPVIMLTTTDDPHDISRCYDLGCNAFIAKPVDARAFVDTVVRLGILISLVEIPEEAPCG